MVELIVLLIAFGGSILLIVGHKIAEYRKVTKKLRGWDDSTDSFGDRYSFGKLYDLGQPKDHTESFQAELDELDDEIRYAEKIKKMTKEKAEKEAYLEALYLPDEEKDVVYSVSELSFHGGLYHGIYATKKEAEDAKSEIEGRAVGRHVRIEEHTLNRPKKEDE